MCSAILLGVDMLDSMKQQHKRSREVVDSVQPHRQRCTDSNRAKGANTNTHSVLVHHAEIRWIRWASYRMRAVQSKPRTTRLCHSTIWSNEHQEAPNSHWPTQVKCPLDVVHTTLNWAAMLLQSNALHRLAIASLAIIWSSSLVHSWDIYNDFFQSDLVVSWCALCQKAYGSKVSFCLCIQFLQFK